MSNIPMGYVDFKILGKLEELEEVDEMISEGQWDGLYADCED